MHSSHAAPLHMIKAIIRAMSIAFGQLIMTLLTKQFVAPQSLSILKLEKFGITNVYFTISLTHWPDQHCDKKASIETHVGTIIMTLIDNS